MTTTYTDHISDLAEGMVEPVRDTVRVLATRTGVCFAITLRENGEPVNWWGDMEALCGDRRPTFFNLIRSGFTIEPVGE